MTTLSFEEMEKNHNLIIDKSNSYPYEYRSAIIYRPVPKKFTIENLEILIPELGKKLHHFISNFQSNHISIVIGEDFNYFSKQIMEEEGYIYHFQEFKVILSINNVKYSFISRISTDPCYPPRACKTWIRFNLKRNSSHSDKISIGDFMKLIEQLNKNFIKEIWKTVLNWTRKKFKLDEVDDVESFQMLLFGLKEDNFKMQQFKESLLNLEQNEYALNKELYQGFSSQIINNMLKFTINRDIKDFSDLKMENDIINKWFYSEIKPHSLNCFFHINEIIKDDLSPYPGIKLAGFVPTTSFKDIHLVAKLILSSFAQHWKY